MKKNKGLIIALLLITVIGITAFLLFHEKKIKVTNIIIDDNISLYVGERKVIDIKVLPEDAPDKSVIWESENNDIALVLNGTVEGIAPGTTKVKVSSTSDKITSECVVQVLERTIEKIELDKTEINLVKGNTITLTSVITPNDLHDKKITWTSSDSNVATVDENGMITAIGNGSTEIKAMVDGITATCKVNVITLVSSIELNKKDITLLPGSTEILSFNMSPSDSSNKEVTWMSSDADVVSVDNGKIVGKSSGTAKIIVTTIDGNKTSVCNVKVIGIKKFDQRNKAVIEYLKSPSESSVVSIHKKMCKGSDITCHRPVKYNTSLTGDINVYRYSNNKKEFVIKTNSKNLHYYLIPNNTYYLESVSNKEKIEVVNITGDLRMINVPGLANMRDLGGYKADGGTVKYGKVFRSATTNNLTTMNDLNNLGIGRVVDLRPNGEINHKSAVESIRKSISVTNYNNGKDVKKAVELIMKAVVNEKTNVLFNCNIGRDRTGTVAYVIEGILGVSKDNRFIDYELTYLYSGARTRNYGPFKTLVSKFNSFSMNEYEQERFINWYLSLDNNKEKDLELINNFRKVMIDGNPHIYKIVNGKLALA